MLFNRHMKLSHKVFHKENLNLVLNILVKNDYPAKFIEKYIKGVAVQRNKITELHKNL